MKKNILFMVFSSFITTVNFAVTPDSNVAQSSAAGVVKTAAAPTPETIKLRYVDPYKVIPGLEQWQDERIKIQQELEKRNNQIEELKTTYAKKLNEIQSKGNLLKDNAKESAKEELQTLETSIKIKQQSFQEWAERATQEAQEAIFKEVQIVINEYAQELGIDIVIAGGALYVNPKLDVSQTIIDRMNAKYRAQKKKLEAVQQTAPKK